jgi:hypothetical protein
VLKEVAGLPDTIQALEAVATVTADDYEQVLVPLVDEAQRTGRRLRLLYQFGTSFERITVGALWADTRLGSGYLQVLDGCAVVSDVGWIREPTRHIGAWMPCPVRVYGNDERDEAVAWLTSLPEGDHIAPYHVAKAYIGGVSGARWSVAKLVVAKGATHSHRAR